MHFISQRTHIYLIGLLVSSLIFAACGADTGNTTGGTGNGGTGSGDTVSGPDGTQDNDTSGSISSDTSESADTNAADTLEARDTSDPEDTGPTVTGYRIEPTNTSIVTSLGIEQTTQLLIFEQRSDGSENPLEFRPEWSSSDPLTATVDDNGLVTVTGQRGGQVVVTATWTDDAARSQSLSSNISVKLSQWIFMDGLDSSSIDTFEGGTPGDPAFSPTWEYPEDGTLFPVGIIPPLIQWTQGDASFFKLTLSRGDEIHFEIFTTQNQYQPTTAQWKALGAKIKEPLQMDLIALNTLTTEALRHDLTPISVQTTAANLAGTVYYWQVETGDIMKIPEGASVPSAVFSTNNTTGTCRGCHTVSADGSRLGFMYNGGGNPRAGMAWTDAPEPAIVENASTFQWDFVSFHPNGNRAAAVIHGNMWLADTTPGIPGGVADLGGIPQARVDNKFATQPSWSPDGSTLSYVLRSDGADWEFYEKSDLYTLPWDANAETFGDPQLLREGGETLDDHSLSYPSWSPDSRWIAYSQGPDNRGTYPTTINLIDTTTGETVNLAKGAPDGLDVFPSFSPFKEGGYYWLLFYSKRAYGHVTTKKQLWVMAIDTDAPPGVDGSHPAFWLPGQDTEHINITGQWAPNACSGEEQECDNQLDCCTGLTCQPDVITGVNVCQNSDSCVPTAGACSGDADCCDGFICTPNIQGESVCQRNLN